MTAYGWTQFLLLSVLFVALTPPLGAYMARVYELGPAPGDRLFLPVERLIYRLGGVDPDRAGLPRGLPTDAIGLHKAALDEVFQCARLYGQSGSLVARRAASTRRRNSLDART